MGFSGHPREVVYSCTALVGTNKGGTLKPDADGYYELIVGALDSYNSVGAFYPFESAKALFDSSSTFMRRTANGDCKAECGHPKPQPGATYRDFLQRVMITEETNVCAHFRDFTLRPMKDKDGREVIGIIAKVKPSGPMGQYLKEALDNKHENVNFSIRSLTHDVPNHAGILQKHIKAIIGFDWVTEPGINCARKWFSPALEAMNDAVFTERHFDALIKHQTKMAVGMENNNAFIHELKTALGWDKPQYRTPPSSSW